MDVGNSGSGFNLTSSISSSLVGLCAILQELNGTNCKTSTNVSANTDILAAVHAGVDATIDAAIAKAVKILQQQRPHHEPGWLFVDFDLWTLVLPWKAWNATIALFNPMAQPLYLFYFNFLWMAFSTIIDYLELPKSRRLLLLLVVVTLTQNVIIIGLDATSLGDFRSKLVSWRMPYLTAFTAKGSFFCGGIVHSYYRLRWYGEKWNEWKQYQMTEQEQKNIEQLKDLFWRVTVVFALCFPLGAWFVILIYGFLLVEGAIEMHRKTRISSSRKRHETSRMENEKGHLV